MELLFGLIAFVAVLVGVDLAAMTGGVDSRPGFGRDDH